MNRNRNHVANDTADTVIYKGRRYTALYIGQTKYGPRAHLEFLDGSKDFWVDADLVTDPRDDTDTDHGAAGRAAAAESAGFGPRDPGEDDENRFNEGNLAFEINGAAYDEDTDYDAFVTVTAATATGRTGRQIYNQRTGRWEPADAAPPAAPPAPPRGPLPAPAPAPAPEPPPARRPAPKPRGRRPAAGGYDPFAYGA
jgi:hypothetical protein